MRVQQQNCLTKKKKQYTRHLEKKFNKKAIYKSISDERKNQMKSGENSNVIVVMMFFLIFLERLF